MASLEGAGRRPARCGNRIRFARANPQYVRAANVRLAPDDSSDEADAADIICPMRLIPIALVLGATIARAQVSAVAPPILTVPGSTRALGVGDAYAALASDPDAIFYNPAQLVPARGISVGVQRYGDGSALMTASAASVLAPGTIAFGVQVLDHATDAASYSALARENESTLFSRGPTLTTGAVLTVGYARPTIFNLRVGVAGKIIHQQFGNERDVTPAFDIGVSRGSTYTIALVGRHLGHGIDLGGSAVALPREVALAAAMPRREVGPLDLAATASIGVRADRAVIAGGGTEWSYNPLDGFTFAGRVGYRTVEGTESHLTLGAGFVGERFNLDYAFQASDGAGSAHRIGIRWR
jgi:hypothetical protein